MAIEVEYIKPIKIKIIMSLKGCVKEIIKLNILNYFLINKKNQEIKKLNGSWQSINYFNNLIKRDNQGLSIIYFIFSYFFVVPL